MKTPRKLMGPGGTLMLAFLLVCNLLYLMRMSVPVAPTQGPTPGGGAPTGAILPNHNTFFDPHAPASGYPLDWHAARGVVTKVDAVNQQVEIEHDGIPSSGLGAGKSVFPSIWPGLPTIKPGTPVMFYVDSSNGEPVVARMVAIGQASPDLLESQSRKN